MKALDHFYSDQEEIVKETLLALKGIILDYNSAFSQVRKYRLPCFMHQNQLFCCLWVNKKTQLTYIALGKNFNVAHPNLIRGSVSFPKLLLIHPKEDIPLEAIHIIFDKAIKQHTFK